jgi:hypothetical protein
MWYNIYVIKRRKTQQTKKGIILMAKYNVEINENGTITITPITAEMTRNEAIKILENYVGDHIAIIGGGDHMSERQKAELREYADRLAPIDECEDEDEDYYDDYEPNCGCHDNGGCECGEETLDSLAARMILRIREILAE